MDKRVLGIVAAVGGVIVGVAGARAWPHAPATPGIVCVTGESAVDAKADAIAKQLHAHDHDRYVPQAGVPIGELPKSPSPPSTRGSAQ